MQEQLNDLFEELQEEIALTYEQVDKDQYYSVDQQHEFVVYFAELYEQLYKIRVYARKVQRGDA